jgi:hypothetical protein
MGRWSRASALLSRRIPNRAAAVVLATFRYDCSVPFDYTPEVLEELRRHGAVPRGHTDPQLVRDWLSDVYKFEIRALKQRLKRGDFPQVEYADRVRLLRRGYVLLSIPLQIWTRAEGGGLE